MTDSIQYTDWWFSGRYWYVKADGHSGCGETKEQAMADVRKEREKFWQKARNKNASYLLIAHLLDSSENRGEK